MLRVCRFLLACVPLFAAGCYTGTCTCGCQLIENFTVVDVVYTASGCNQDRTTAETTALTAAEAQCAGTIINCQCASSLTGVCLDGQTPLVPLKPVADQTVPRRR